jgi:hypothetical protein
MSEWWGVWSYVWHKISMDLKEAARKSTSPEKRPRLEGRVDDGDGAGLAREGAPQVGGTSVPQPCRHSEPLPLTVLVVPLRCGVPRASLRAPSKPGMPITMPITMPVTVPVVLSPLLPLASPMEAPVAQGHCLHMTVTRGGRSVRSLMSPVLHSWLRLRPKPALCSPTSCACIPVRNGVGVDAAPAGAHGRRLP